MFPPTIQQRALIIICRRTCDKKKSADPQLFHFHFNDILGLLSTITILTISPFFVSQSKTITTQKQKMKIKNRLHPTNMNKQASNAIQSAILLVALVLLPSLVSSSPSAATKIVPVDQSGRKANIWGVISKTNDSLFLKKDTDRLALTPRGFPKHIILMGAPASGKGTQCEYLQKKHGLVHISTGDLLRRAVSSPSADSTIAPYLSTIKKCIDSGKLIPDEIMTRLVLDRLNSSECQEKGWVLDGFPRTLAQANALQNAGIHAEAFLHLNVPDEVAINRVIGRRTDPLTGRVYHMEYNPPPNDSDLRQRLIIRSDDTAESMQHRLKQFHANLNSVKNCYSNVMREIDGLGTPDNVSNEIHHSLKSLTKIKLGA